MKRTSDSGQTVPPAALSAWMNKVKELNRAMSRYARAVDASERRLRLETELLKQAVTLDNLDREATFTSTLEALKAFEVDAQRTSGGGGNGTSSSAQGATMDFTENAVTRAMHVVSAINTAMSGITDVAEPEYGDAAQCLVLRDATPAPPCSSA